MLGALRLGVEGHSKNFFLVGRTMRTGKTHDAVMHVHKLLMHTPNKRAKTRESISEVRKIYPSDGLFRHFEPKE